MGISSLQVFSALSDKMRWHQARQSLLTENVANAQTPGFEGRDLKPFSLEELESGMAPMPLGTSTTSSAHFSVISSGQSTQSAQSDKGFSVTSEGANGGVENEMMKVAENQMDYQAVTTLYTRSVKLLKTALGRTA